MLPCERFEEALTGYEDLTPEDRSVVNAHIAACSVCHEFLDALTQVDQSLMASYSGVRSRRPFSALVLRKPSAWPEVLDFCGWAAVLAALVLMGMALAEQYGIRLTLPS